MNKTILLAAAAVAAVLADGASVAAKAPVHKPDMVLWNQNSNFNGAALTSQNFTSGTYTSQNSAGADDFVVPQGQTWHITAVDVTGVFFNGSGPAKSTVVTFYTNRKGKPGRVHRGPYTLDCGGGPDFQCIFPKPVKLPSGIWWVSVAANCSYAGGCGEWGWAETTTVENYSAVWEQGGGPWKRLKPPVDLAFTLRGNG